MNLHEHWAAGLGCRLRIHPVLSCSRHKPFKPSVARTQASAGGQHRCSIAFVVLLRDMEALPTGRCQSTLAAAISQTDKRLTLSEAGCYVEGHLQRLLCVQARVAMRVVARVEVGLQDAGAPSQALGHIIACHLQVQAAGHRAQLLMYIKECLHLQQIKGKAFICKSLIATGLAVRLSRAPSDTGARTASFEEPRCKAKLCQ